MDVGLLDHYNILTRKLDETVRFYERALGMRSGPRPPFDVPGAWLYRGDHPVVHVIDIAGTTMEQGAGAGAGAVDHIAFLSHGFAAMKRHLDEQRVPFSVNLVPNSTRCQIFVRDPNDIQLELNFEVRDEDAVDMPEANAQSMPGQPR
ncbi:MULTISPECIES: VOC family protein [Sphingomonadaceae]|uniref:Glyoxalase n=1 Tax=Sphingobium fluviale TaxID=2506423 RepID=A0A4Q1KCR3_9SPHN|nr:MULTISPECIES: VOC family protein [Sphingomonadaceae]EZP67757.1 Lactoylglutathione lyase-like lyase [Sphingomonas paucimobilis]RXR24938.1 glyoxalase [Sphingobium fluviale]